jgi:hypothetical protein
VYGRNGIPEVRPDEIEYIIDYKNNVSRSVTIYVPFGSVHTCYTFHTLFQVKKRSRLHKTPNAKEDESGKNLLKDYKKKGPLNKYERKKDQCPFHEEDDSFVRVRSMKKLLAPSLEGLPSDMVIKANDILGNFQSSWVRCDGNITKAEMTLCSIELKQLFGPKIKTFQRRPKQGKQSNELDIFYENHVLSKINITEEDESGRRIVVNLGTFQLSKYEFVYIFKSDG